MLFQKRNKPAAQLPQSEREAIVDLLHLCLYADAHISLKEGEFIEDVIEVIGWDKNLSFSSYEARSIAGARDARSDEKSKKEFVEFAAERLKSKDSRVLALSLCSDLFGADGTQDREAALLAQIKAILK
jgi:uncharacterized tellurite resistance protein B-like protein